MAATDTMLKSNIRVMDINTVRGHISQMNRGRLGQRIEARGAEMIGINIWDALDWPPIEDYGEPVTMRGTPIGPDYSTFDDAQEDNQGARPRRDAAEERRGLHLQRHRGTGDAQVDQARHLLHAQHPLRLLQVRRRGRGGDGHPPHDTHHEPRGREQGRGHVPRRRRQGGAALPPPHRSPPASSSPPARPRHASPTTGRSGATAAHHRSW